ncbi:hypothetical protein [Borrelia persica]|nr:hypothetical protein [Borrelia persica]
MKQNEIKVKNSEKNEKSNGDNGGIIIMECKKRRNPRINFYSL